MGGGGDGGGVDGGIDGCGELGGGGGVRVEAALVKAACAGWT